MVGQTVSHYKILEKLGEGGMGIVYKAEDTLLKRTVALKFLPSELTQEPMARERFMHEAQAASALEHSNICSVHEIAEHDGQTFIVMGYYRGETITSKIARGPLPVDEAVSIACQIAEGLLKAHEAGIIHRDIKPANIIVTEDGIAKILDFGLAKASGRTLLTKSGTTLGTAAYMSPEQLRGEAIDHRSDIWSLGVTLYEMLAGTRPFASEYEQGLSYLIINEDPKPLQKHVPGLSPELARIVHHMLEKKPGLRYSSAKELLADLRVYQKTLRAEESGAPTVGTILRRFRKPKIAIPAVAAVICLITISVWFLDRQAKIRWARENALPEIAQLIADNDFYRNFSAPYSIAEKAEQYIPDDPKLVELMSKCSVEISIATEPPGARIFVKNYDTPESEWNYLGVSPLSKVRLPATAVRWKIDKEGCDTILAASSTFGLDSTMSIIPDNLVKVLDRSGTIPPGMVHVQAMNTPIGALGDFYIDRYETTNRQFKEFINAGGYRERKYWKQKFLKNGKEVAWENAMNEFVDQTGQHAPSGWQGADYPEGQGEYPVSGISWYEAAAYAEFVGKTLPTEYHWNVAQGGGTMFTDGAQIFAGDVAKFSNFAGKGPVHVGKLAGITAYGAFDMGGNVREWCWNETPTGRVMRGGSWNDNPYMLYNPVQFPAMNRSSENGVRCALYLKPESIPAAAFGQVKLSEAIDASTLRPVSDEIFAVYREQFSYDKTPLNARVESRQQNSEGWTLERITLDAAYGHERFAVYLFLPTNSTPPYQTVIYFPSGAAMGMSSSRDIEHYYEVPMFLSFLIRNGRAVLFPVYDGTFERPDMIFALIRNNPESHLRQYTESLIKIVKDFKRAVDYLETRQDIDTGKLAYYGLSYGGFYGGIIPAVDDRLKASILLGAGLDPCGLPEACQVNYLPRVRIPTLMLIGKYDPSVALEPSHFAMFDLLGTAPQDKQIKTYETSHIPERKDIIKETLAWLDHYLGPVNR